MSSISSDPSSSTPSFVLRNITIDDTDSSLKYSQGWEKEQLSQANGGSFQFTKELGANLTIQLPANSVAVYYLGFELESGSLYETCLDCETENSKGFFDAQSDSPSDNPTILFSLSNLNPDKSHVLEVFNVGDKRFNSTGTITLDSLTITVRDPVGTSSTSTSTISSITTSSTSSESTTSLMSGANGDNSGTSSLESLAVTSATSATSSGAAPASGTADSSQKDISSGETFAEQMRSHPWTFAGIILAILFVVFTAAFALMYFMRRRKRKRTAPTSIEGHWATRFFGEKGINRKEWNEEGREMHEVTTPKSGTSEFGRDKSFPRPLVLAQRQAESPIKSSFPNPPPNAVRQVAHRDTLPSAPSYLAYEAPRATLRPGYDIPTVTVTGPYYPEVSRSPTVTSISAVPQSSQPRDESQKAAEGRLNQYTSVERQPSTRRVNGQSRDPTAAASHASGVWEGMKSFTPPDPVSASIPPALMMKTVRFSDEVVVPEPSGGAYYNKAPPHPQRQQSDLGYSGTGGMNYELDSRVNPYVAEAQRRVQERAAGVASVGPDRFNGQYNTFSTPQQYQQQQRFF